MLVVELNFSRTFILVPDLNRMNVFVIKTNNIVFSLGLMCSIISPQFYLYTTDDVLVRFSKF